MFITQKIGIMNTRLLKMLHFHEEILDTTSRAWKEAYNLCLTQYNVWIINMFCKKIRLLLYSVKSKLHKQQYWLSGFRNKWRRM